MSLDTHQVTWDASAQTYVAQVWESASTYSFIKDGGIDTIRDHLDYMIDNYFNKTDTPTHREWLKLGVLAVSGCATLDEAETYTTLVGKQRDYGPNNIARFGNSGLLLRLHDKVARLENLVANNREATNESIQDTYLDIVGYSVIGLMLMDGSFFSPMITA